MPGILNPSVYFVRMSRKTTPCEIYVSVKYQSIHDLVVTTPYSDGTGFGSGTGGQ
jgi:hypothetical protein